MYHVLVYEYAENMVERRVPHRDAHLARVNAEREAGRVVMAGATGDPPSGALIVFAEGVPVEEIEAFASGDPYGDAGLVTSWRVEPWAAH